MVIYHRIETCNRRVSLKPLTEPPVQRTCTGETSLALRSVFRSQVVFGDFPWKRLSIFDLVSLSGTGPRTRLGHRVFIDLCGRDRARTYDLCYVKAVL